MIVDAEPTSAALVKTRLVSIATPEPRTDPAAVTATTETTLGAAFPTRLAKPPDGVAGSTTVWRVEERSPPWNTPATASTPTITPTLSSDPSSTTPRSRRLGVPLRHAVIAAPTSLGWNHTRSSGSGGNPAGRSSSSGSSGTGIHGTDGPSRLDRG